MSLFNVNEQVTSRLTIIPEKNDKDEYLYNGLCPVKIINISTGETTYESGEFEGHTVKDLRVEFESIHGKNDAPRYYTHVEKITVTKKYSTKGDKNSSLVMMEKENIESIMVEQWKRIKHIFDNLYNSPNFKALKDVEKKELDKHVHKVTAELEGEDRIKAYEKFFDFLANFANNDGNPMWVDKAGNPLEFWAIFLPQGKERNHYALPNRVQKGFIEPLRRAENGRLISAKLIEISTDVDVINRRLKLGKLTPQESAQETIDAGAPTELSDDVRAALEGVN